MAEVSVQQVEELRPDDARRVLSLDGIGRNIVVQLEVLDQLQARAGGNVRWHAFCQ
jgi:hypothetical protein